MNQQALSLQRLAESVEPKSAGSLRWLVHSAGQGSGVSTIRDNLSAVLQQMGWSTDPATVAHSVVKAQVCESGETAIDLNRLVPNALLIFVLDATPVTLVNTYSQIKQLVAKQSSLRQSIAVVSNCTSSVSDRQNRSFDHEMPESLGVACDQEARFHHCPAKTLIRSCKRFLQWEPAYLGALPFDPMVGIAASENQAIVQRWPSSPWSQLLHRTARRALMISQQIDESTQEPDMLSLRFAASTF